MGRYLLERVGLALLTMLMLSIVSFIVIQAPPGDYMTSYIMQMQASGNPLREEEVATLRRLYGLDQGDLAMLAFRTADHLRQMAGLRVTHPRLAEAAKAAVDLVLKEPVIVPL